MEHAQIVALIHQTAPTLVADGDQLTLHFYRHLFAYNPQLQHTFNMANQAKGTQARSLFNAIVLFVTRFDELAALGPAARQIAATHVSVDVRPEDYALVGASLLATIRERLGPAATPEVMQAWELAYGRIAEVLIGVEADTYQQHRAQPGGWNGYKPFVVARIEEESRDIKSFYLRPEDGQPLPEFRPGQFVSLALHLPYHPHRQLRQYSLSAAPDPGYYRITVKREPRRTDAPSPLVSNYLHDQVRVGNVLQVHAPTGEFCLPTDARRPVVLLAGGLGITPFMAMLEQELRQPAPRPLLLVHAVRDAEHHPFRNRLQQLAQQHPALRFFSVYQYAPVEISDDEADLLPMDCASGFLMNDHLDYLLTPEFDDADFFCCGPLGFMRHVNALLKQRGVVRRHFEVFGPTQDLD
jgi:nitric oxide dioxygenase